MPDRRILHSNKPRLRRDVGYESYKAHRRGPSPIEAAHFSEPTRIGMVAVKRAVFQSVASMYVTLADKETLRGSYSPRSPRALPAFTIHTAVKQAKKAFKNVQNPKLKTWGPTATGLGIIPILPYLFDKPVEHATDTAFEWIEHKLIERQESAQKTAGP